MRARRLVTAAVVLAAAGSAAAAVGLSAVVWWNRTAGGLWHGVTPSLWAFASVSPRQVQLGGWRRADWDPTLESRAWRTGRYAVEFETITPGEQRNCLGLQWLAARGGDHWHGFGWLYGARGQGLDRSFVVAWAPTWAAVSAAATLPTIVGVAAVVRRRRRAGGAAGHCRRCGYDLRASPGRCPECGAASGR